jgi:hypothetical protein
MQQHTCGRPDSAACKLCILQRALPRPQPLRSVDRSNYLVQPTWPQRRPQRASESDSRTTTDEPIRRQLVDVSGDGLDNDYDWRFRRPENPKTSRSPTARRGQLHPATTIKCCGRTPQGLVIASLASAWRTATTPTDPSPAVAVVVAAPFQVAYRLAEVFALYHTARSATRS